MIYLEAIMCVLSENIYFYLCSSNDSQDITGYPDSAPPRTRECITKRIAMIENPLK